MRSPSDMEFIQIDVTNACNMRCSNCTRFCGNHERPFFMDFDTFRRAVDSLDGFDGVTGIIGGEPTLHPEFERMAEYLRAKFGPPSSDTALLYPQKDFIHTIHRREFESAVLRRRPDGSRYLKKHGAGLWSNMGRTYRRYYEAIQDTFSVQYLNDHLNPSYHQPALISRKDLGVPDDEWFPLRDRCWVQNTWSASITPKGAFFCEIAASLDMLFHGPGGWPLEPGWWKRKPEDFGDQLQWCEFCGFALNSTVTRDSREETDDASPTLYRMLEAVRSPKLRQGKVHPVRIENGKPVQEPGREDRRYVVGDRYLKRYEDRFQEKNSVLFEMDWREAYLPEGDGFGKALAGALYGMSEMPFRPVEPDGGAAGGKPPAEDFTWLLASFQPNARTDAVRELTGKRVFHPGVLYRGEDWAFFCKGAAALRKLGFDRLVRLDGPAALCAAWEPRKVVRLSDTERCTDLRRPSLPPGTRCAVWGAGMLGEYLAETVELSGGTVAFVADRSPEKQGTPFAGVAICAPERLAEELDRYDKLLIAHHLRFEEIRDEAVSMGIPAEKILLPFEV